MIRRLWTLYLDTMGPVWAIARDVIVELLLPLAVGLWIAYVIFGVCPR